MNNPGRKYNISGQAAHASSCQTDYYVTSVKSFKVSLCNKKFSEVLSSTKQEISRNIKRLHKSYLM